MSQAMAVSAARAVPDYKAQREEIHPLLQQRLKKGDTWYLVDVRWLKQWKKYVGYDQQDQQSAGVESGVESAHPGPVDTASLLKDPSVSDELKGHLLKELDYSLLPEPAWERLVAWYGMTKGSRPIQKKVVEYGLYMKHRKVEVYLLGFNLCVHPNMNKCMRQKFSRADAVGDLEAAIRNAFHIPESSECRMWHQNMIQTYELLSDPKQTLQDAGLYDGQTIVLEVRNSDGTWPRTSGYILPAISHRPKQQRSSASKVQLSQVSQPHQQQLSKMTSPRELLKTSSQREDQSKTPRKEPQKQVQQSQKGTHTKSQNEALKFPTEVQAEVSKSQEEAEGFPGKFRNKTTRATENGTGISAEIRTSDKRSRTAATTTNSTLLSHAEKADTEFHGLQNILQHEQNQAKRLQEEVHQLEATLEDQQQRSKEQLHELQVQIQHEQQRAERSEMEVEGLKRRLHEQKERNEQQVHELQSQIQHEKEREARNLQEQQQRCEQRIQELLRRLREQQQQAEDRAQQQQHRIQTLEAKLAQSQRLLQDAQQQAEEGQQRLQHAETRLQHSDQLFQDMFQRLIGQAPQSLPTWAVQRNEIHLTDEQIGTGGWAHVRIANFRGQRVAAKCLHGAIISAHNIRLFTREMNMAVQARHPNLLQFIGATMDNDEPIILTEVLPTSLRRVLEQGTQLSREEIISILSDVARALNYLHLMSPDPIIHRDVSSANVLLEPSSPRRWKAKVSDYGSANFMRHTTTAGPGNPVYAAPEANDPQRHSPKMDVYSFGILLIEMCSGELPANREELIREIRWPQMVTLIRQCVNLDPQGRPDMADLITELGHMTP